jgi:LPXTG-site transpeptidase (sortase) family protein
MKRAAIEMQSVQKGFSRLGTDPLTTILVGLALCLTAAVVALSIDLWLRPQKGVAVVQALAAKEPARLTLASPVEPTLTPMPSPSPTVTNYPAAVRIRIPVIAVDRSIVELPLTYDPRTKSWERDYDQLFRQGKKDLVGHYGGSASPGQPGNTILVGHNYGYGVNGVFLRLGRLEVGQQVEVVNAAGQTFTYRVTEVTSVPWAKKNEQELMKHQPYLSVEGPERLTLVTCGGSTWAPFPNRVYVVADPAR